MYLQSQFKKYDIEYLWISGGWRGNFLKGAKEISGGKAPGVRIYDLRPTPTTQPTTMPAKFRD